MAVSRGDFKQAPENFVQFTSPTQTLNPLVSFKHGTSKTSQNDYDLFILQQQPTSSRCNMSKIVQYAFFQLIHTDIPSHNLNVLNHCNDVVQNILLLTKSYNYRFQKEYTSIYLQNL